MKLPLLAGRIARALGLAHRSRDRSAGLAAPPAQERPSSSPTPVTRRSSERAAGNTTSGTHSYYFDNGFLQRGDSDIGRDVVDYGFPATLTGARVLDIGTGSGWFAAYFEQLGAEVTVTDARGYCDFDVFGRDHYPGEARAGSGGGRRPALLLQPGEPRLLDHEGHPRAPGEVRECTTSGGSRPITCCARSPRSISVGSPRSCSRSGGARPRRSLRP
jgi:hypothetical protein